MKIEQVPMASPANEKQPVRTLKNGYLDDVFSIFKARQHPFVLLEESALRWMGLRVCPEEVNITSPSPATSRSWYLRTQDLDLLIRDSEMQSIKADLLATDRYEFVEQNLDLRFSDTYTQQVPRLRLKINDNSSYNCISLWSERVYMLNVDGEKIEVPDPHALNVVLMEECFDLHPSWAQAVSISYTTRITNSVRVLPPTLAQSADMKFPVYIPTIPRILDALLDQARYRVTCAENFPGKLGNRPRYHLQTSVRYLHLEKPQQRERLLPKLAERNRGEMEAIINKFKRKPLLTLTSLQHKELNKPVR